MSKDKSQFSNYSILLVDDDQNVREGLRLNLELEGFKILTAEDGVQGLEIILNKQPDLVIMDVMMPNKDGLAVTLELRKANNSTPIILLTARDQEMDKVLGLELGADDYLPKPFGMPELIARVKAILRRVKPSNADLNHYQFGEVKVDFKAYKAEKSESSLELSAREYRLLHYLVIKEGNVVTRDELLDEVWGYDSYPTTRTVDNHISKLRQKIENNVAEPEHILTVHGVGYKFVA